MKVDIIIHTIWQRWYTLYLPETLFVDTLYKATET